MFSCQSCSLLLLLIIHFCSIGWGAYKCGKNTLYKNLEVKEWRDLVFKGSNTSFISSKYLGQSIEINKLEKFVDGSNDPSYWPGYYLGVDGSSRFCLVLLTLGACARVTVVILCVCVSVTMLTATYPIFRRNSGVIRLFMLFSRYALCGFR